MVLPKLHESELNQLKERNEFFNLFNEDIKFLNDNKNNINSYVIGVRYKDNVDDSTGRLHWRGSVEECYVMSKQLVDCTSEDLGISS